MKDGGKGRINQLFQRDHDAVDDRVPQVVIDALHDALDGPRASVSGPPT